MRYGLRTRLGIMATSLAVLLLAAGCGNPGGVDGDLTNGWGPMAAATGFEPSAGACHGANFNPVGARGTYEQIDCNQRHRSETAYLGTYESPAADADAPPAPTSAGARRAYQICDEKITAYVGGPWRTARLWIGVTNPSPAAWKGGARWFRCEVLEISSIEDDGSVVPRAGTLRGALAKGGGDLLLTCYAIRLDSSGAIGAMPPVGCNAKHNAEFVGVWDAGKRNYPKGSAGWDAFHDGCRRLIATYARVPYDKDLQYRTGVVSLPGGNDVWQLGDHQVRCYLWLDGAALTGSLKGKGVKRLPVQYK